MTNFHRRYAGQIGPQSVSTPDDALGLLPYSTTPPKGHAAVDGPQRGARRLYRISPAEAPAFRLWLLHEAARGATPVRVAGTYPHYTLLPGS